MRKCNARVSSPWLTSHGPLQVVPASKLSRRLSVRLTAKAKGCLDTKFESNGISPSELVNSILKTLAEKGLEDDEVSSMGFF